MTLNPWEWLANYFESAVHAGVRRALGKYEAAASVAPLPALPQPVTLDLFSEADEEPPGQQNGRAESAAPAARGRGRR